VQQLRAARESAGPRDGVKRPQLGQAHAVSSCAENSFLEWITANKTI
jgi:hypothetical protein